MTRTVEGLWLDAASLWSKWGFNDGDCPDEVIDWGTPPLNATWPHDEGGFPVDWHAALRVLVNRYLIPALGVGLAETVQVYRNFDTSHNPCRVESIDGVEIGDDWDTWGDPPAPLEGRFASVSVFVPRADVVAAVNEVGGWRS